MDRIGALRKDIVSGVGMEVLMKAYDILETEEDGDTEVRNSSWIHCTELDEKIYSNVSLSLYDRVQ